MVFVLHTENDGMKAEESNLAVFLNGKPVIFDTEAII
jgi:hypothetical protein